MDLRGLFRLLGDWDCRGAVVVEFSRHIASGPIATTEGCQPALPTAVPT